MVRTQRSKRVVQETILVGSETAVRLKGQTEQMEKVVQDLDQIHFDLKKAGRLMRDITRQMATDKVCFWQRLHQPRAEGQFR